MKGALAMRVITLPLLLLLACGQDDPYHHAEFSASDYPDATECEDFCVDRRSTNPDDAYDDGEYCDGDGPVVFCTITSSCPYYCVSCDDGSSECSSCDP